MTKILLKPNQKISMLFMMVAMIFSFQAFAVEDTYCGHIADFEFSNGYDTVSINDNDTYFLGDLPNNFYIDLIVSGYSESASFEVTNLGTGQVYYITENHLPYTFPAGNSSWNFGFGEFEIKAKLYKYNYCDGTKCDEATINFTISPSQQCGDIANLQFSNGYEAVAIVDNGVYELSALPNNFYSDIVVNGFSESALLKVENLTTGQVYEVGENYLPYTAPGGNNSWSYGTGDFKITANIFEFNYCQGNSCDEEIVYFTINDVPPCGQIDGFEFSNFTSDPSVAIVDGGSYNINNIPSNFNVNILTSGTVESAGSTLTNVNTGQVYTNVENVVPYTFPGATTQVWTLGCGTYQLCSTIYLNDGAKGTECDSACITFTLTDCQAPCGIVDVFNFSNGSENTAIVEGGSYNISDLPSNFYVDTVVAGESESVRLTVTNLETSVETTIIENYIPYTYPAGGAAWDLGLGDFRVKSEVFSGNYCNATLCDTKTITFTLTDAVVCVVDAGTGTPALNLISINQGTNIFLDVAPNGDANLSSEFILGLVITDANTGVIESVSDNLSILLPKTAGDFIVHVLAFDPATLDFSNIVVGTTTAVEFLNFVADNVICLDLDLDGSPITIVFSGPDERVAQNTNTRGEDKAEAKALEVITKENQDVLGTDVKLFPNPVVDQLNIEINLTQNEVMNYSMVDLNGKLVLQGTISSNSSQIDTKVLSQGLYILKLKSDSRSFTKKIVKK